MSDGKPKLAFAATEYATRVAGVRAEMEKRRLDALLVLTPENYFYLTGFETGGAHSTIVLVLPLNGEPIWVVRKTELSNIRAMAPLLWAKDGLGVVDGEDFVEVLAGALRERGLERGRIGVDRQAKFFNIGHYLGLQHVLPAADLCEGTGIVELFRRVKSSAELAYLRRAGEITAKAIGAAFDALHEGVTDSELTAVLLSTAVREGSGRMGSLPFVSAGKRTAMAHASWAGDSIARGDLVNVELAACFQRYHVPTFRVFSIGRPAEELCRMHDASERALEAALAGIEPGMNSGDADRIVRDAVDRAGYGECFVVRAAYGIGLAFPPGWGEDYVMNLRPHDSRILEPGMCFHLVPALYKDGLGAVCCSMPIVVTERGVDRLSPLEPRMFIR